MSSKSHSERKTGSFRATLGRFPFIENVLQLLSRKDPIDSDEDHLEPLLPVADRETYERYAAAFSTIINRDVTCVAVTGPYGAGKTSLINAFIENYPKLKFIRISLATFEGDDEKAISSDRIEKSILQQLIYSAGRKKLEYSRFKKIRKPRWLYTKALLLSFFAVLTGAAIIYWQKIEEFLDTANRWSKFVLAGAGGAFWLLLLFLIVHGILKASAGLSIKKFSLKNAEIETEDRSKESVFNKHLDEIVYFFQETPCDIVIIEDLDRFGKTEIFTKIREINQLINANPDVRPRKKKQIVFLFAIRDDLFQGKDRTKFFDLLIPVIPFVSAGNAYDVLHNKLVKAGLRESMKNEFLRQVTIYVTDNRHLVNIVNEYSLYRKILSSPNQDPNKLFAIILYKVFFPSDFGKLHMNQGVLADLVGELRKIRIRKRDDIHRELKVNNEAQNQFREAHINSRETLIYSYVGLIQCGNNELVKSIHSKNSNKHADLNQGIVPIFDVLGNSEEIKLIGISGRNVGSLNIKEMGNIIHPGLTLHQRLSAIDRNKRLMEKGFVKTRTDLETQLRDVRYMPVNQAFSAEEIREKVSTFDHGDLFVYLVMEGYLGEDYEDYTAHFHKGATTRSDREYVQRFNKSDEIDWNEKIDTPSEILLILGDGLFGKPQGFNITMIDYVLGNAPIFHNGLIGGFKAFPDKAFQFLQAYYLDGEHVEKLLRMLVKNWNGFLDVAAECKNPLPHIKEILGKAQEETISALRQPCRFIEFIERSAPEIFDCRKLVDRLPLLKESGLLIADIGFPNLLKDDRDVAINAVAEHALWKISPENIATILAWQGIELERAQSEMFLSLCKVPNSVVTNVEENINSFVENCFLQVESTSLEPQDGVEKMLSISGLKKELGKCLIARQQVRLRFSKVPRVYWTEIVDKEKYVISWDNFDEFLTGEGCFSQVKPIFRSAEVVAELAKCRKEIRKDLFEFLVDFDDMDLNCYQQIIGPELGKISNLPTSIDYTKKLHLINSGMIELNESGWNWLLGNPALRVALIEKQFTTFEEIKSFSFSQEELSGLLKSKIPPDAKRGLLKSAGPIECGEDVNLRAEVLNILVCADTAIGGFDADFVERIMRAAPAEDAIKLLIRTIPVWDKIRVMRNLKAMGSPYQEIAIHGKRPKIEEGKVNNDLVEALQESGMISRFKKIGNYIRVFTKRT